MSLFTAESPRGVANTTSSWDNLKIGGGGYCTGLDINSDGTMVTRVDVYGAYLGSTTPGTVWKQLITTSSMPASYFSNSNPYQGWGVNEIRIAPSDSNTLYMIYTGSEGRTQSSVLVSTNKGKTWRLTNLNNFSANSNDNTFEYYGQKLAIDPNNSAVCYLGTPSNGLWVTTDTGNTWTLINTSVITTATGGTGYFGMAFDPTSGTTSGKTNRIIIPSFGQGVWVSTNAGSTFTQTSGAPTTIAHAKVGADGTYFCVAPLHGDVWRMNTSNVWKDIMSAATFRTAATLACDPNDKDHLVVSCDGCYLNISSNATVTTPTWSGVDATENGNGQPQGNAGYHFVTAADVPWIQNSQDFYLSDGNLLFDPNISGRLWFSYGDGVIYTNSIVTPGSGGVPQQVWNSQIAGIENLVANYISWPNNRSPILVCWDRPLWRITDPNKYPANYGPNYVNAVQFGSSADWLTSNPDFNVGLTQDTGGVISTDAGVSWTAMSGSIPGNGSANGGGGTILVSDSTHFVVVRSDNFGLYNSTDGGATWNQPASAPTSGWGNSAFNSSAHVATQDRTNGKLYAYNNVGANAGIWVSADKGITWSQNSVGNIDGNDGYMPVLKAAPGQTNNLFFTSGNGDDLNPPHPGSTLFWQSTNGGVTWNSIPNVAEVINFGFSAPKPGGGGYPAIGIVGWVNGIFGVWRSDDNCATWNLIGSFNPRPSISGTGGWIDEVRAMEGNPNNWNRWILGFKGSSFMYYGPGMF